MNKGRRLGNLMCFQPAMVTPPRVLPKDAAREEYTAELVARTTSPSHWWLFLFLHLEQLMGRLNPVA